MEWLYFSFFRMKWNWNEWKFHFEGKAKRKKRKTMLKRKKSNVCRELYPHYTCLMIFLALPPPFEVVQRSNKEPNVEPWGRTFSDETPECIFSIFLFIFIIHPRTMHPFNHFANIFIIMLYTALNNSFWFGSVPTAGCSIFSSRKFNY